MRSIAAEEPMKRRRDYVDIPRAELERLYYDEGLTQKEIGVRFGVTSGTISHRMIEYGLTALAPSGIIYA